MLPKVQKACTKAFMTTFRIRSKKIPAGAGGVIFTPWLHGNRCPFEDPNAAGMFFNIRIEYRQDGDDTGCFRRASAFICGGCWSAKTEKVKTSQTIRFVRRWSTFAGHLSDAVRHYGANGRNGGKYKGCWIHRSGDPGSCWMRFHRRFRPCGRIHTGERSITNRIRRRTIYTTGITRCFDACIKTIKRILLY